MPTVTRRFATPIIVRTFIVPTTVYNDSGSGTIPIAGVAGGYPAGGGGGGLYGGGLYGDSTYGGSDTYPGLYNESHSRDASRSGTIPITGTGTGSDSHSRSATGTIPLSGTGTDEYLPGPGGGTTQVTRPMTGAGI